MHLEKLDAGKNPPYEINVFVEIPQNSAVKYELDKKSGVLMVDRFLHTSMNYPFNYGFIPSTKAEDGDPLDVLLISSLPVNSGAVVAARPIGVLEMEDEAGLDNKILAVPVEKVDPHFATWKDIVDVSEHLRQRIKHFFESYKQLEPGKWVKVKSFLNRDQAEAEIRKSIAL
jgi:inorganic pyrophosphatase